MEQVDNIFEKGCLVHLSTRIWTARKKLSSAERDLLKAEDIDKEVLSASKSLIDPDTLEPIRRIATEARSYLYSISLPFPIRSLQFVGKETIELADAKFKEINQKFDDVFFGWRAKYPTYKDEWMKKLGPLANETDYPLNISDKFGFAWRFLIMDAPNGKLLPPELYEKEKNKFIKTMEEAQSMGVQALRTEFGKLVNHMIDKFTTKDGKTKTFRNTTLTNFFDFFETFKNRNIFNDADLNELVENAQKVLHGQDVELIRKDEDLKKSLQKDMLKIQAKLDTLSDKPLRKLELS